MSLRRRLGYGIALLTIILVPACTSGEPYKPVRIEDIGKHIDERVVVEGFPSLVTEDGFILRYGDKEVSIERVHWGANVLLQGNYPEARKALETEATDGDQETVKIYGIPSEDDVIGGIFVEVEGALHEIYK